MERKQFTFYKSFYTAIRRYKRTDRCDIYDAMLDYVFEGVIPDLQKMSPNAASTFELIQPTLDAGRRKAEGGAKGKPGTRNISERYDKDTEKEIEKEVELELETEEEYECIYADIVSYLNEKTGKAYRHTSRKTRSAIHARLEEGFGPEDFRSVIDRKCADWLGDSKMEEYLRPETLFGPKFESYLNAGGNHGSITRTTGEARVGHYL